MPINTFFNDFLIKKRAGSRVRQGLCLFDRNVFPRNNQAVGIYSVKVVEVDFGSKVLKISVLENM